MLATFTVFKTTDATENTIDAVGTLRQTIHDATASLDIQDTINFSETKK